MERIRALVNWSDVLIVATLVAVFLGAIFLAPGLGIPFAMFVLFAGGLAFGRLDLAAYVGIGLVAIGVVVALGVVCFVMPFTL